MSEKILDTSNVQLEPIGPDKDMMRMVEKIIDQNAAIVASLCRPPMLIAKPQGDNK